jgi:hypothetical protein
VELEEAEELGGAGEGGLVGDRPEAGDEDEVFGAAQVGVEIGLFGDVAKAGFEGDGIVDEGAAVEKD